MTINSPSIPTSSQAAAKSGTLLAALATEAGTAKRSGQNFAQLLGSVTQPPAKPAQPPLPERAPLPRVEVEPPARPADVPRSTEPVPVAPDRAPAQTERNESQNPATPGRTPNGERTTNNSAKPVSAAKPAPTNSSAAKAPGQGADSDTAELDPAAAGTSLKSKRAAGADEEPATDAAGNLTTAAWLASATPEQTAATGPSAQDIAAAAAATAKADAEPGAAADAPAPTADPASLASLMPSVAQAVFGAAGSATEAASKATASADDAAAGLAASGSDGALPLVGAEPSAAAPLPGGATKARPEPLDTGKAAPALTGASATRAESPALALTAGTPDSAKALALDGKPQAAAASFGQMLQAAGATAPAGPGASTSAAGAPVTVHSPLHEPGFAPEMASRLTLLASEGVQKAQLHLNPAEMGPVSVQIQLDGQQAQVEFHAQHAATREVLERSLPELAAALRDAGMTLSGGGVFQQPRDTPQDGQAQNQASGQGAAKAGSAGAPDNAGSGVGQPAARRTQAGVLDMYA